MIARNMLSSAHAAADGSVVQVALIIVLHFGCGGGLKGGCAAYHFVVMMNRLAGLGICVGLMGSICRVIVGTYEFSILASGISIQWGEPAIANCHMPKVGQQRMY